MTFLTRLFALLLIASPAYAQTTGYSTTAASNTSVDGVSIAEGMAPGNVNDAIRGLMADIATGPIGTAAGSAGAPAFTFNSDTNNGLFAPAADTIAATHAGSEQWRSTTTTFAVGTTGTVGSIASRVVHVSGASQSATTSQNQTAGNATHSIWNTDTAGDNVFASFLTEASPTLRGLIDYNRAGTAVRYNTTSDGRLKENVADAAPAGSIIDAIRVRKFDWKEGGSHTDYGFIAQELVEHVPDAVRVGDAGATVTDAWAVDYSKLVPLLVKEVQALRARVATLEAQ